MRFQRGSESFNIKAAILPKDTEFKEYQNIVVYPIDTLPLQVGDIEDKVSLKMLNFYIKNDII